MEDLLAKGGQTAFPILVVAFLLVRLESRLEALTKAIASLQGLLSRGCLSGNCPARDPLPEDPRAVGWGGS